MKNLLLATSLIALSSLSLSTAVQADDDTGFYAGIGLHRGDFSSSGIASSSTKGNISAGYMFNDRIGVDASFYNIADDKNVDVSSLTLTGVYKVPVSERFDVYGKLGFARTAATVTHPTTNAVLLDGSGTDLVVGLGAKMDFGQHNILLEYIKFDPSDADFDLVQVGYRYEF